jgi:DMSO reductase anchor subunit
VHPALSVIVFTTASGAGYGLLALTGLLAPFGLVPGDRPFGALALALALGLVTLGLLSSTLHLGRPERAWRAFSQWRSSWLSREGVAAVATYVPAGLFALLWAGFGSTGPATSAAGLLAAAGAIVTVICTAMIYRSLKPIQRWCNGWTVPTYLALSAMTGALWLAALAMLTGGFRPLHAALALVATAAAAALKFGYWRFIDTTRSVSTPETATGLGGLGKVRLLDPPHTEDNYLLKEMGYRVARKHAAKLRRLALLLGFVGPAALTLTAAALFGSHGWAATVAQLAAALLGTLGILIERWLFFAEAKHTVTLYYGAVSA